jgi:hypothetical protein
VIIVVVVGDGHLGRGLGGAALRHVDDQGLGHLLAAREVGVEGAAHFLLGPQGAVLGASGVSRNDAQRHVGRVEATTQRVLVFFQDHVAHVVDQIVLADLHQRGRGIGPLDPYLAVQHAGCDGRSGGLLLLLLLLRRRGRGWDQQRFNQRCIGVGDN